MFQDSAFATINMHGSDHASVDYAPHNKGVTPVFVIESVIHPAESAKAGRAIYVDVERVLIKVAGDSYSTASCPVDAFIIERFQEAYDKWKKKGQAHINGTPLSKWPLATPSFIKEMEYHGIFSVDDLAAVADVNLDHLAEGRLWRDRAASWLKSANDGAAAMKFEAENSRLREEISRLSDRLSSLETAGPSEAGKRPPWSPERRAQLVESMARAREAKALAKGTA